MYEDISRTLFLIIGDRQAGFSRILGVRPRWEADRDESPLKLNRAGEPALTRTSRNQKGELGRWRMRCAGAAYRSLTVAAPNLVAEFSTTFDTLSPLEKWELP